MKIFVPTEKEIPLCAEVYISAYKSEPWNETYKKAETEKYISDYLGSKTKICFAAEEKDEIIGIALCLIVPGIGCPFLRIEDFCISGEKQGRGLGTEFLKLIFEKAKELGCDSVLLGTQKGFPSHRFYLKNGFLEIGSALLYKEL